MRALAQISAAPEDRPATTAAAAYNEAGDDYLTYADGDPRQLYAFDSQYAYGDRRVWSVLDAKLTALRARGARSVALLDIGCGPGTWLRRLVIRARALGFSEIRARGFDVADAQIRRARHAARGLQGLAGVDLTFDVGDATRPLPEADRSIDITLCLYCVFNHIEPTGLQSALGEIARVTRGTFVTTVRAVGSTPTIFVDAIEHARQFSQDNAAGRFSVEMLDGRRMTFNSRLFAAADLRQLAATHFDIEDLRGVDLFHTRFAHDSRWNPASAAESRQFRDELVRLEEKYGADPEFMDHATHLMLVGRGRGDGRH